MIGRIDIHSHLLPGVDDGCESVADSIRCARELVAAGYTHSFCTPHIWPSFPNNNPAQITKAVAKLQLALDDASVALSLMPGGELNMRPDTQQMQIEELVSYGMARRFVLIDLWAERLPDFFDPSIEALQAFGVKVILAHPERMRAVQGSRNWRIISRRSVYCFRATCNASAIRPAQRRVKRRSNFFRKIATSPWEAICTIHRRSPSVSPASAAFGRQLETLDSIGSQSKILRS